MYTLTYAIEYYGDELPENPLPNDYTTAKEETKELPFQTFEEGHAYIQQLIQELDPYNPPCFSFYYTTEDNEHDPEHHIVEFTFIKSVDLVIDGFKVTEELHNVYFLKDK